MTKEQYIEGAHYLVPKKDCVYPIGVDYMWGTAANKLSFTNVMKMKISVILAIAQMSIGIFMKAVNATYHKDWIEFFFEFLPQIILLWVLFGYMDILIIGKWLTSYVDKYPAAPPIIPTMINNFLNFGIQPSTKFEMDGKIVTKNLYVFDEGVQKPISQIFLLMAFITIPLMLCVKPCYLGRKHAHEHERAIHDESVVNQAEQEKLIDVDAPKSSENIEKEIQ